MLEIWASLLTCAAGLFYTCYTAPRARLQVYIHIYIHTYTYLMYAHSMTMHCVGRWISHLSVACNTALMQIFIISALELQKLWSQIKAMLTCKKQIVLYIGVGMHTCFGFGGLWNINKSIATTCFLILPYNFERNSTTSRCLLHYIYICIYVYIYIYIYIIAYKPSRFMYMHPSQIQVLELVSVSLPSMLSPSIHRCSHHINALPAYNCYHCLWVACLSCYPPAYKCSHDCSLSPII